MPYCFKLNGTTEENREVGFPDPEFHQEVSDFLDRNDTISVRLRNPKVGILPLIRDEMNIQGAKEWFCSFSNRIGDSTPLTVTFRV